MVSAVATSDGHTQMVTCDQGMKVNASSYQKMIKEHHIPWIERTYPNGAAWGLASRLSSGA